MNKRLLFYLKLLILLGVISGVAYAFYKSWKQVHDLQFSIDWRWGGIGLLGFAGSMLTSATIWRRLARRMGDRSPTLPLLASYTYSQMGKYIPGKVVLLFMRIQRAGRFGMNPAVCTLSTLLENALYMISGAIVGTLAIARIAGELPEKFQPFIWPATITIILLLSAGCYPPIFYNLVNRLLRKMKKPEVPASERLGIATLALAVLGFVPCWCFGGLALWGSVRCIDLSALGIQPVPLADSWWFAGAYSLSVIIGMASLLPGGTGIRDAALGAAAALQLVAQGVDHHQAILMGGAVAVLQRVFQLIVEVLLGLLGMLLTAKAKPNPVEVPTETP